MICLKVLKFFNLYTVLYVSPSYDFKCLLVGEHAKHCLQKLSWSVAYVFCGTQNVALYEINMYD